jgi:hypothetical protein
MHYITQAFRKMKNILLFNLMMLKSARTTQCQGGPETIEENGLEVCQE